MGLSGTDEYWKLKEQAERIYHKKAEANSSSERDKWVERGHALADRLREEWGYNDSAVKDLINWYDLDRS